MDAFDNRMMRDTFYPDLMNHSGCIFVSVRITGDGCQDGCQLGDIVDPGDHQDQENKENEDLLLFTKL